jgi:hypothetical protein
MKTTDRIIRILFTFVTPLFGICALLYSMRSLTLSYFYDGTLAQKDNLYPTGLVHYIFWMLIIVPLFFYYVTVLISGLLQNAAKPKPTPPKQSTSVAKSRVESQQVAATEISQNSDLGIISQGINKYKIESSQIPIELILNIFLLYSARDVNDDYAAAYFVLLYVPVYSVLFLIGLVARFPINSNYSNKFKTFLGLIIISFGLFFVRAATQSQAINNIYPFIFILCILIQSYFSLAYVYDLYIESTEEVN